MDEKKKALVITFGILLSIYLLYFGFWRGIQQYIDNPILVTAVFAFCLWVVKKIIEYDDKIEENKGNRKSKVK